LDRDDVTLIIKNGHFKRYGGITLEVDVQPDGTFEASKPLDGGRLWRIAGTIVDGKLEAEIGSNHCAGRLLLNKVR